MSSRDKAVSYISLCRRAGRLVGGELACSQSVKGGKSRLLIIAEDASENTKKKFRNSCEFYGVKYIFFGTKVTLGIATGKINWAVISIEDEGFAVKIIENIGKQ